MGIVLCDEKILAICSGGKRGRLGVGLSVLVNWFAQVTSAQKKGDRCMYNKQVLLCFVMSVGSHIGHSAALSSTDRIQNIVCGREHITLEQFNSFLPQEQDDIINKLVQFVLFNPIIDHGIVYDTKGQHHLKMPSYLQEAFFCVVASPHYWTWALAPLVARGARLEDEYCRGTVALEHARLNGDWENVAFTKELGVDGVEYCQGRTALMQAAYLGNGEKVAALLALGANIEAVDRERYTALTTAACHDYTEVVKLLVAARANVEAVDLYERSAFKWAVYRGNEESVRVLIDGYRQQLAREKQTIEGFQIAERITNRLQISPEELVNRFLVNCHSGDVTPIEHQTRIAFELVLRQVRENIWRHLSDEDVANLGATKCGLLMRYAIEEGRVRIAQAKAQRFTYFIQNGIEELDKYHVSFPMVLNGSNRIIQMAPRSEALKQLLLSALHQGYLVALVTPMHFEQLPVDGSQVVPMQIEGSELCAAREERWLGGEVDMGLEDMVIMDYDDVDGGEPAPKRACLR